MSFIMVMTTTGTKEEARDIAKHLVEQRLAACVQIMAGIESTYLWKGNIETAQEFLCLIKTRQALYPAVEAAIKKLHSYETPEILALPIACGSREYLDWISDSVEPALPIDSIVV